MFQGSMVALVTPMSDDGRIDYGSVERLLEFHLEAGTDAIVAAGTTGESATLETREHVEYLDRVIRMAGGRIPVIAGTGSNSTAQTLSLSRRAEALGADACLLVVPYYNRPTQDGLYRHFRTVAEAISIPCILYNVPSRTVTDLLPETVERLSVIPNITGIKEATGDLDRVRDILNRCQADFELYSGDDSTAAEIILAGGRGVISVTANVAPRLMHEMCSAALAGNADKARGINDRLTALHKTLFVEANPIPVKWALHAMDMIPAGIRLPLTPLSAEYKEKVRAALEQAGVLSV